MRDLRIALRCDDPSIVASMLGQALGIEFETRDSQYWGTYWTDVPKRSIRVFANEDPMHRHSEDSPSEFYFESTFPKHRTLIDIECDERLADTVAQLLATQYPDFEIVSDTIA